MAFLLTFAVAQEEEDQTAPGLDPDEPITLMAETADAQGSYVTDNYGMAVYAFVSSDALQSVEAGDFDEMTEGVRDAAVECTGECQEFWPPVYLVSDTSLEEGAGDEINTNLLYTTSVADDPMQLVYNGWPLYYFAQDGQPGDLNGHGLEAEAGIWLLLGPDGNPLPPGQAGSDQDGAADGNEEGEGDESSNQPAD